MTLAPRWALRLIIGDPIRVRSRQTLQRGPTHRAENVRYGPIDRRRVISLELGTPRTVRTVPGLPSSFAVPLRGAKTTPIGRSGLLLTDAGALRERSEARNVCVLTQNPRATRGSVVMCGESAVLDGLPRLCTRSDDDRVTSERRWKVDDHLARRDQSRTTDWHDDKACRSSKFDEDVPHDDPAGVVDHHSRLRAIETVDVGLAVGGDDSSPIAVAFRQQRLHDSESGVAVAIRSFALSESLKEHVERHDESLVHPAHADRQIWASVCGLPRLVRCSKPTT